MNNMIKFILTTSGMYHGLAEKDVNALYFLDDTGQIFRGERNYSESVEIVDALPDLAAVGRTYIIKSTMASYMFSGTDWVQLSPSISNQLTDDEAYNGLVTGEAIKAYIAEKVIGGLDSVTANLVKTTKELAVKGQSIGSYNDGDIIPAGTSIQEIISKQLAKQIPPSYSKPTSSLNPSSTSVECGVSVNPTVSTSYSKRDGGDLTSYSLSRILSGTTEVVVDKAITLQSYSQASVVVPEGNNLSFKSDVAYAQGPIKQDNLGNDYPTGRIPAGSLSVTSTYTGKRKSFYQVQSGPTTAVVTSADVRALTGNTLGPANGNNIVLQIPAGSTRITVAYPATLRDITKVISSGLNLDVKDTFVKSEVSVEGSNGYMVASYKVFTYIPAIPFGTSDTYTVTI